MLHAVVKTKAGKEIDLDLNEKSLDIQRHIEDAGEDARLVYKDLGSLSKIVRLYSDSDVGQSILQILTENDDIDDAWLLNDVVTHAREEIKTELEQSLLSGQYRTKEELYEGIRQLKLSISPHLLTFYSPLEGDVDEGTDDEYLSCVDNDVLLANRGKIEAALVEFQSPDFDLAKNVGGDHAWRDKLVYMYWGTEEKDGTLYGRIDCYLTDPLRAEEVEELREEIDGQNSDGFGEGFGQQPIQIKEGELYVSYWHPGPGNFVLTDEEMKEFFMLKDLC